MKRQTRRTQTDQKAALNRLGRELFSRSAPQILTEADIRWSPADDRAWARETAKFERWAAKH